MSQELERLKKRLLKSNQPNPDFVQVINLCEIMKLVGGYEQLVNMPIPAMHQVMDYIIWYRKEEQKAHEKNIKKQKRKK